MNELEGRQLVVADLATGIVILALGGAILALSIAMPDFAERNADPLTAPGIFPGVVGAIMVLLGARLTLRSTRAYKPIKAPGEPEQPDNGNPATPFRLLVGFLMMAAAVFIIGRADFRFVMSGFCLAYCLFFVGWRSDSGSTVRRIAAVAAVILIAGILIPIAFEEIFLVRMP